MQHLNTVPLLLSVKNKNIVKILAQRTRLWFHPIGV